MEFIVETGKILAGGLVAAMITLLVNGRRLDQDRARAARNLAIQLTDVFENFALACVDVHDQHSSNRRESPYDPSGIADLPNVSEFPADDIGWRALETALAIDARTFATRRNQGRAVVSAIAEHGTADDVEVETDEQAVILGDAAWRLALRLRAHYKLGASHVVRDIADHFAQGFEQIEQRRATDAAMISSMWSIAEEQKRD